MAPKIDAEILMVAVKKQLGDDSFVNALVEAITPAISDVGISMLTEMKAEVKKNRQECTNKIDELEQQAKKSSILIFGMNENKVNKEASSQSRAIKSFKEKLEIDVEDHHIDQCYRLGRIRTDDKPRPLIIKFTSAKFKDLIIKSRKSYKGSRLIIREDLTLSGRQLVKAAINIQAWRNVWTVSGRIYPRKENGVVAEFKNSETD